MKEMSFSHSRRAGQDRLHTVAILAIVLAFGAWSAVFIARASHVSIDGRRYYSLADDALVSMRYSWNLAHGYGLVWNPGERVEGYTNLLQVVLMAIPNALFSRRLAAFSVQLLGCLVIGTAAWTARSIALLVGEGLGRGQQRLMGAMALLATLSYYPLVYWSLLGMETGFVCLLTLLGIRSWLISERGSKSRSSYFAAFWLGLAFLARPDSLITTVVFLGLTILRTSRRNSDSTRSWRASFLPVLLFIAFPLVQLGFRVSYYGELLPNTYLLKVTGLPLDVRLRDGLTFVSPMVGSLWLVFGTAFYGVVRRPARWKTAFVSVPAGMLAYQVWSGGEAWPYWRIVAPTIPLLFIVFMETCISEAGSRTTSQSALGFQPTFLFLSGAVLIASVFSQGPRATPGVGLADFLYLVLSIAVCIAGVILQGFQRSILPQRIGPAMVVPMTIVALLIVNTNFLPEALFRVGAYKVEGAIGLIDTAVALDLATLPDATVGVFHAGTVPYYTGRYAIDFLGKCDPVIARLPPDLSGATGGDGMLTVPGHNKYDLTYSIVNREPVYAEGARWGTQDLTEWAEKHYALVYMRGVPLRLRRSDPAVLWGMLDGEPGT